MDSYDILEKYNEDEIYYKIKNRITELRKQGCSWDSIQVYYWKLINNICYDVEN